MPDAAIITAPQSAAAPLRSEGEYLTRRQAADYIRDLLGRPMSFSTASKLAALGEFAPPVLWWGRRPLYTRDGLRAWAEAGLEVRTAMKSADYRANSALKADLAEAERRAREEPQEPLRAIGRDRANRPQAHTDA